MALGLTAQTPPNLGAPSASAVVSYKQGVIAIQHVRVHGGPLFITREMPYSFPRLYLTGGVTTIRTTGNVWEQCPHGLG